MQLPPGTSSLRVTVDESLQLLTLPPVDAALYSLRLAAVIVVDGSFAVYRLDASTGGYDVPAGAQMSYYPIWQSVTDTPTDRVVAASGVASEIVVSY